MKYCINKFIPGGPGGPGGHVGHSSGKFESQNVAGFPPVPIGLKKLNHIL